MPGGTRVATVLQNSVRDPSKPRAGGVPKPSGRFHSSLGATIAWTLAGIFLAFGLIQFVVVRKLIMGQFESLEQRNLLDRTRQAFLSLNRESVYLDSITTATAAWGDTYDFMARPGPRYLEKAFSGSWPKIYDIDFVVMVALDGRTVWASDGYPSFELPGPAALRNPRFPAGDPYVFPRGKMLNPMDSFVGLVGDGARVWIYCIRPITDDTMQAKPRGALIFGRLIGDELLASLQFSRQDRLSLEPAGADPGRRPAREYPVALEFPVFRSRATTIQPGEDSLVSLTPLADAAGKPLASFRLAVPNTIHGLGGRFLRLTSASLFIMAVLTLVLILLVVRRTVIQPIARIAGFFTAHSEDREEIQRIGSGRADEIGILAEQADLLMAKVREQKLELENQANTDGLTGLANRHRLEAHVQQELRRIFRLQRPNAIHDQLAVALIDVDHFKAYNDTYGHLAGDACLRALAGTIRVCAHRPGDLTCRFGGEEFVLVLSNTDEAGARVVAEQVRSAVQNLALPHQASPVLDVVTVSIGIAAQAITPGFRFEELMERADKALYAAKQSGRNRVLGQSV